MLSKIRHDGQIYNHGDTIKRIKREEGERLIKLGAAEEIGKKSENEDDKKKTDEETKSDEVSD